MSRSTTTTRNWVPSDGADLSLGDDDLVNVLDTDIGLKMLIVSGLFLFSGDSAPRMADIRCMRDSRMMQEYLEVFLLLYRSF